MKPFLVLHIEKNDKRQYKQCLVWAKRMSKFGGYLEIVERQKDTKISFFCPKIRTSISGTVTVELV